MKFTSRDLSLKRTPSKKQSGVFGVKINVVTKCVYSRCLSPLRVQQPQNTKDYVTHLCCLEINATSCHICRRERSKVPYIVRQCIEEVEKRGIDEVGIYRISGVATDIQALKSVFDTSKNPLVASQSILMETLQQKTSGRPQISCDYNGNSLTDTVCSESPANRLRIVCETVCLTCRHQRHPGDAERHGHQRHRGNTEAVFQGAAGASADRPPLPRLHGGHR